MNLLPLRKLIVPLILLIAAITSQDLIIGLYPTYGQLFELLPYATLIMTMVICAYYNRSRLFTAAMLLLVSYMLIQTQLQISLLDPRTLVIYSSMGFLIPVTVFLLLLFPERGLYNFYGVFVIAMVPLQVLLVAAILAYLHPQRLASLISSEFPIKPFAGYVLSIPATGGYLAVFLAGLWRLLKTNDESTASLISVLIFSFSTMAFFDLAKISTIMFSAAGISLIFSLMSSSYDMAFRDELTGLLGRRALNDRLKGLGRRYVIAMVDVDHFKKFNDSYGHEAGDDVLKMVAKQIDAIRGGGTAYRYGGEEFCIVFPGKTLERCIPFLDSVRRSVESYHIALRNLQHRPESPQKGKQRRGRRAQKRGEESVSVTISIGVAERDEQNAGTDEVLKAADAALYEAKEGGRNCIKTATK